MHAGPGHHVSAMAVADYVQILLPSVFEFTVHRATTALSAVTAISFVAATSVIDIAALSDVTTTFSKVTVALPMVGRHILGRCCCIFCGHHQFFRCSCKCCRRSFQGRHHSFQGHCCSFCRYTSPFSSPLLYFPRSPPFLFTVATVPFIAAAVVMRQSSLAHGRRKKKNSPESQRKIERTKKTYRKSKTLGQQAKENTTEAKKPQEDWRPDEEAMCRTK